MFNRFFKTEIDEREDMRKTISLFKPQIEQLKSKADAVRVEKQKNLLLPLDSLMQQRQGEIPGLKIEAEKARQKEERLRAEAEEALKVRQRTACELSLRSSWFDRQEQLIRAQIYELAPAVILERQKKWRDMIEEARLKVETETRTTRPNIFGQASEIVVSNVAMINRRVRVISEAIKSAEEMKSHPLSESEILKQLDGMQEKFPPLTDDHETVRIPVPDVSELQRASWR